MPQNDRLAHVAPTAAGAAQVRGRYSSTWTTMNHLRTGLAIVACGCFLVALRTAP